MSRIMLLYDKPSMLIISMENLLKEEKHTVFSCELSIDKISKYVETPDLIYIYADENLDDNMQALVYVKDIATENDIPVFYAGDEEQIIIIERYIPDYLRKGRYTRPINIKEIVSSMISFLNNNSRESMKKILVIDDSGAMLRNVKGWLDGKYKVVPCNSVPMAFKYLSSDKPDLILLDYEMPVVDGKQMLEMLRNDNEYSAIPVIFLTNKGDKNSVLNVMALKPQGYILKSMPPDEIVASIDEFFKKDKLSKL